MTNDDKITRFGLFNAFPMFIQCLVTVNYNIVNFDHVLLKQFGFINLNELAVLDPILKIN